LKQAWGAFRQLPSTSKLAWSRARHELPRRRFLPGCERVFTSRLIPTALGHDFVAASVVAAALVAAIHALPAARCDVDGRDEPTAARFVRHRLGSCLRQA
jgi:hypothetical protein